MKWARRLQLVSVPLGFVPRVASAQTTNPPATFPPMLPTAGVPSPDAGEGGVLAFVLFMAVVLAVFGAIAKVVDFRRKREEETVVLRAEISDALLADRAFVGCVVLPTVHVPFWGGSPATIEISGEVPSSRLEQRALALAARVASKIRSDVSIVNRMAVVPSSCRCAA